ncbi:type I restriction enzyme endonuclease domain-containing protein [Maritimibacter sp. UBA3975]|uniref:type I restriction enzyme endonuclease domain-containing protein n=1 Tax=Maritimibacter sp. UBA3975 TaxID=1946833 RepID=UPI0025BD6FDA|nr:type I restriction enzyme endonuclease domain-containing protein [Maritimibacter sp. UBA3975]
MKRDQGPFSEVLGALSTATDLAAGNPPGSALPTTVLAVRIGRRLGRWQTMTMSVAMPAETIVEVANINDPDALKAVVEETGVSESSKADRIAGATRRAITEKMDEDPTFYKQFSELLEKTIRAYREKRLSEREYLNSVVDFASKVARKDRGRDVPESIWGDEDAQAFFGVLDGQLKTKGEDSVTGVEVATIAQLIMDIIKSHLIVDIWSNEAAQNNLRNAIDDYFFDVLRDEKDIDLPVEVLDDLELKIMDLARARFAA